MTIAEFQHEIKLRANKIDTQYRRDFSPLELDVLINEGINLFVDSIYEGNNFSRKAFETSQSSIDDISTLVIKQPYSGAILPTNIQNNIYEFKLSSKPDYRHLVRGSAFIQGTSCAKSVGIDLYQHDDLDFVLTDPYKGPSLKWGRVPATFGKDVDLSGESSIFLYSGGEFTIINLEIEYIKNPVKISIGGYNDVNGNPVIAQETDLPEQSHRKIIDLVVMEIERILKNPEGYQLFAQKLSINN